MAKPLNVLMIEDSENDALLILRELSKGGYTVTHGRVDTADGVRVALEERKWDIVISDFVMPSFDGLAALRLVQEKGLDIPFVVVSGKIGEDTAVDSMKSGAHDYIMKTNLKRLVPAVERELRDAENRRARRKAEDDSRVNERLYRLLAENVADVIWTVDENLNLTYISPSVWFLRGFTSQETLTQSIDQILTPASAKFARQILANQKESFTTQDNSFTVELEVTRKEGPAVLTETRVSLLRNEGGNISGLLGVSRDISERKEAQELLGNYQKDLRSLASQLAIAEERERRRIAVELHDRVGQTQTFCIMQICASMKTAPPEEKAKLDDIYKTLRQLAAETRSLTFELSPPALYDFGLESALKDLEEQMEKKYGVHFVFANDGEPKPLKEDVRVLLFQATRELLFNAVKHAQAKEIKIEIRRVGDEIRISVEDNGVGFDTDLIYSPRRAGGFGFFSIRERLNYIGGHLEARSREGIGSRITMVAPLENKPDTAINSIKDHPI